MSTPILLDCDPGHDDAVAILLALGSAQIRLLGITTCFGNCDIDSATRNALRVLELAGRADVPVAQGASRGMAQEQVLGNYVHGVSGLDGPELPVPSAEPIAQPAVEFLHETLSRSDEPVTLVVTGPMTNVGILLRDHPEIAPKIHQIVFMGGSTERGNHTPTAEFNTYADPEALDVVLRSGIQVRMVGLNLTHQALATAEVVERMRSMDHRVGQVCAEWMGFFGGSYETLWEFSSPPVHDPCTIAGIIDEDVIEWRSAFVAVELEGEWTRGTTVVDLYARYPQEEANVMVAMKLDAPKYWDMVLAAIDEVAGAAETRAVR